MPVISVVGLLVFSALSQTTEAPQSMRDRGIAAFQQGRYSSAASDLEQAAKDPSDRLAATFLALTKAAQGDCQTALPALLQHVQDQDLSGRLATMSAIRCADNLGQSRQAFDLLDAALKRYPQDADLLYLDAKLHMKAFNDATYLMFQRAPNSYRVHELSAEIFEINNRFSEAIPEYQKAIELNPTAPDLHYRLGRAFLLAGHSADAYAKAESAFEAELRLSPEDAACEYQLAQIARVQGKPDAYKQRLQNAVDRSPKFTQALVALGRLYAQEKNYPQAIDLLSRATHIQPDNEAAHYALLTAYRDSGDVENAKREKAALDRLQKPPEGEFTNFLKKLGEKPAEP